VTTPRLHVGIAELEVARGPVRLHALALGSCVAVILHDAGAQIGGLAHVLLPSPSVGRPRPDQPARFAPAAVAALLSELLALGAERSRITARLVGGASMFTALQPPGTIQMGERNVAAVREALHRHGLRLIGEVVGGDFGRSVEFEITTGRVIVTSYQQGTVEL
jgi:chemotaxis protein CheD